MNLSLSRFIALPAVVLVCSSAQAQTKPLRVASPNGQLAVEFRLDASGAPRYKVNLKNQPVLSESRLGLLRDDADFSRNLKVTSASGVQRVEDRYEILTAKRRRNFYWANQRIFHLATSQGKKMDVVFQVSDGGVAFRYLFPESDQTTHTLKEEVSSFHVLPGTKAWMQPMSVAKTGFAQTNPSYEEHYRQDIAVGTPSPSPAGWVYPALFRSGQTWLLLSESGLERNYCASRLQAQSPDGDYQVGFPDPRENFQNGPVNPVAKLPWQTPWRLIVVGDLKTVTESTLGIDLAPKPATRSNVAFQPGKASWSWVLKGDGATRFEVQKQFVDYASAMGWRYCLIDALWDTQIGDERIKQLTDYARTKNVQILVWYNSAGDWNTAPQTPRSLLLTHESRVREFGRMKGLGVAGLKVDFFGGDGQSFVNYYMDILEDALPYGLVLNFHGATLPRGLQRTYPNLMTVEAIRGEEFITFGQGDTDRQPTHCAMLPFTRNVFDPMDFTPVVLDRLPRTNRRTTSAFELALSVLFTSGIQHYAETPEGMAKAPDYVQDFLKKVPSVWEDSKFIAGFPGQYAVMARRGEKSWYVAGINAEASAKTLTLDLSNLGTRGTGTLIRDGEGGNLSFTRETIQLGAKTPLKVTLPPYGGFVFVLN